MERERNRRILFASGVGVGQRIAQLVASVIMLPVLIHELGVSDFGVWGAATSLAWLSGMLDLGIGSSLLTLLPKSIVAGRPEDARQQVTAALFGGCALALIVLLAGIGFLGVAPMLVAVIGLALNIPLSLAGNIWFGLQKGHVAASWEIVQTLLVFATVMVLAALHAGVVAMVAAVYVPMLAVSAMSLTHLLIAQPQLRPRAEFPAMTALRQVLGTGGLMFATSVAYTCCYTFDNVIALERLGPAASAQAAVALRICTLAAGMLAVLTQPLWPAFVEAVSLGEQRWALRALRRGTLSVLVLSGCGALLIAMFGGIVLRWWLGPELAVPGDLLLVTAVWIIVMSAPRVASMLFNAASVLRFQLLVALLALGLSFALKPLLASRLGVAGLIAAAPLAWLLVVWPAYLWKARQARFGRAA